MIREGRFLSTHPTEVVWLATKEETDRRRTKGNWAALGKQTHAMVLGRLRRSLGATLPGMGEDFEMTSDMEGTVQEEFRCRAVTGDGVLVIAILDALVGNNMCVEVKSGGELKGRHVLQLMINCWVLYAEHNIYPEGVLYFRRSDTSYILPNGGNRFWDEGQRLCNLTARIVNRQDTINAKKVIVRNKREGQGSMTIFESEVRWSASLVNPQDIIDDRREFDGIMARSLKPLCDSLVRG